jgi:hypothetical protein
MYRIITYLRHRLNWPGRAAPATTRRGSRASLEVAARALRDSDAALLGVPADPRAHSQAGSVWYPRG